jgi:hypothetical protein
LLRVGNFSRSLGSWYVYIPLRVRRAIIIHNNWKEPIIWKSMRILLDYLATSLKLKMGYYHIGMTPYASTLCTVVLPGVNMSI